MSGDDDDRNREGRCEETDHKPIMHDDELGHLLPFYRAGRLGLADHEHVEKWIEGTPAGRRVLEKTGRRRLPFTADDFLSPDTGTGAEPDPSVRGKQAAGRRPPVQAAASGALDDWLSHQPRWLAWGLVALLLLVAALSFGLV